MELTWLSVTTHYMILISDIYDEIYKLGYELKLTKQQRHLESNEYGKKFVSD